MTINLEAANKVLAQIERDELAQLGCDLTSIPSPTGQEKAVAEFILAWFEGTGSRQCGRTSRSTAQCGRRTQGRWHRPEPRLQRPHRHELHRHQRRICAWSPTWSRRRS